MEQKKRTISFSFLDAAYNHFIIHEFFLNRLFSIPGSNLTVRLKTHMIISVHLRKCAGSSFRKGLVQQYKNRLLLDYGDEMGSSWPSSIKKRKASAVFAKKRAQKISKDFDIIHGHFYPEKYDFLRSNSQYITFMRDPVQRVLSNYFYLKRKIDRKHPDALIVNQLGFSLEEFANHPDNKNVQAHCLQTQDLKEYQFVGITEYYNCLLYTSPSPRDATLSRMPSSA